jgi:glycosyltransferase involved in cell wall biosynthesis
VNILSITAGAADMYCGSCLRDNALAAELMKRGQEVTLLPVYTPTVTDEPNASSGQPVFFGGISVYLQQHFSIFRHTPWLLDRLWDAPSVIKTFASRSIQVDPRMLGALTVSTLKGEGGYQRKEMEKLLHWLRGEPRPDVVNLPNSLLIALAAPIRRALDRPVVVTLQGEDLFLEGLPEPYKTESLELIRQQVGEVDLFVAVSEYYARFMKDYLRIPHNRIRTVPLGVNVQDLTMDSARARPKADLTIGYFARVAPEKGLHNLVEAYGILRRELGLPASRLRAAGHLLAEHRPYLDDVYRRLERLGLRDEFEYVGSVDRATKVTFLHSIDLLSVPSPYRESKGLYLLEAMACGVPVVQPDFGSFPEMINRTGGGILVRSEAPADVAPGIMTLVRDREAAIRMGERGAAGVRSYYTIGQMADRMLAVYGEVAGASDRAVSATA